ncbi:hypothetical protein, conserved [Babesia bigemina]|uniref:Uncharacterized protein n=1 Tax=Babesia bigemina TaxID=5866 RepID=A0A061D1R2_BABBI|nr:hypothetical protein, conserved [Babesia bigemina]CDR94072.1 hypothetical protein, conserved [Babesia bigemina]|eukprot:XP_012766258.1 hypothetical protein, conserved [Babesia bigemina]
MTVKAAAVAVSGAIQAVRAVVQRSRAETKDLCAVLNRCCANKAHRYVLSSVDSVFHGLTIPSNADAEWSGDRKSAVLTLCKLPRAVYLPRSSDVTRPGPDLGAVLDGELQSWDSVERTLQDYSAFASELAETAEFVSAHSLDGAFGPLRPSAVEVLNKYKQLLLQDTRLGDLRKLTYAAQLLHVLKMHSIDSDNLTELISAIVAKTPQILRQCSLPTLDSIAKIKLPSKEKEYLDYFLRMVTTKPMKLKQWSELFWLVARNSDNRNTIDSFLHCYKIVARHMNRVESAEGAKEKAKSVLCSSLMNVVYGVTTLQKRLRPSDPVYKNALGVLEAVWPLIEARLQRFEHAELIDIAHCYLEHHKAINPQMRHGSRNCVDLLVREFVKRSGDFMLRDWVALFEVLDTSRDAMVVNVLMQKPANYYVRVAAVQQAWVEDLARALEQLPLEELADNVYSLSLPQCSNLCKHLVAAGCYNAPVSAVLERRCLALITDLKYQTTRHVMDFYFVQLQMVLPQHNALRSALESNKPLRTSLEQMSCNTMLRLLGIARHCGPAERRVLLQKLAERIESNVLKLAHHQCLTVLRYAARFKDGNLTNAVLAAAIPPLLETPERHKGFYKMLEISKFALSLPRDECSETSPAVILSELVVQHAPAHVRHLTIPHLDLLLQNVNRSGMLPKPLFEVVLSHAMEVEIMGAPAAQLSSMMRTLSELGVRHENLLERLEEAVIMSVADDEPAVVSEVLVSAATSLAHLGMRTAKLNELFEHVLARKPVTLSRWDYDALSRPAQVNLLHAMALFGTVNEDLERVFTQLVRDCEREVKDGGDAVSFAALDAEAHRKLYDTYISLLVGGFATGTEEGALAKSEFLLEHLPCYHWFSHREQLCTDFKASPHYLQFKGTLEQLGLEGAEPRVTEAYFAHAVLDSPECKRRLPQGGHILYCVPPSHELRWWTPKGDTAADATVNRIESYQRAIGQSARVIDHLQRSGWNVATVFLREWDALEPEQRGRHLLKALKLKDITEADTSHSS